MARPTKAVSTKQGVLSKEEEARRRENEKALRGKGERIDQSSIQLTKTQQLIRDELVEELRSILANVDRFLVDQCAIALDRLIFIEDQINKHPEKMFDRQTMVTKNQYFTEYCRLCNELSMSPQARAKLSNNMTEKVKENPLLKLLSDD